MPSPESREDWIVREARKRPPAELSVFLDGACAEDLALRQRIESLLRAQGEKPNPTASDAEGPTLKVTLGDGSDEAIGQTLGRYKLLEQVGEGGCGVVYVAEQTEPVRRRVALKVIKLGMDTKAVIARFEAERQALALMDHPNIAKVLDAGATETGRPYFVMELVRGIRITDYCDQNNLSTKERLDLFIPVCQAIQHAHQKGIIHRDIKPSNILVTLHDGVPVPKVIDFGIAKATEGRLTDATVYTQLHQFIGTPAYMSPEQAEMSGLDVDTRSDIYSLGVLLYELLTGKTPFDAQELISQGIEAMRKTIREKDPVRPSTRLATLQREELTTTARRRSAEAPRLIHLLRGDLDWVVMKCLEKDRTRRYETANGLAADLKRHLLNEPVVARPPSAVYRLEKSFRRNRVVYTAAGLVALALLLGTLVSAWQAVRATKLRGIAEQEKSHAATEATRAQQAEQLALTQARTAQEQRRRAEESDFSARQTLYAADMLLAQQAQQDGNLGLAVDRLNRHRLRDGQPDLRNWEWRYLWSICQSDELGTFATNSGCIKGLAISPDGTLLSTGEWGPAKTAVKIWGFPSGKLIATPELNDASGSVAFSPDGQLLAFGTWHHGLKVWGIAARQERATFPGSYIGGGWNNQAVAFSPDGQMLAAAVREKKILVWDLAKETLALEFGADSSCLTFAPGGTTLMVGDHAGEISFWSLTNGSETGRLKEGSHPNSMDPTGAAVASLAVSPNGKVLASASWDKTVRIWDLNLRVQVAVLTNHTRWVSSIAFSPDGKVLASASADATIKIWDTANWQELRTLTGSRDEVYAIAFSRDGKTLISGGKNGVVTTWDPGPKVVVAEALKRPPEVSDWWLRDGVIYGLHTNQLISYWSAFNFRQTASYVGPGARLPDSWPLVLTSNGKMAWANKEGDIVVWDLAAQREIARLGWVPGPDRTLQVSPDEKLLVGAGYGLDFTVWNLEKLQKVATFARSEPVPGFGSICFNGDWVATGNFDGTIEVLDLRQGKRVSGWQAHQQSVDGLKFFADGKHLVSASEDATVKVWTLETFQESTPLTRTLNAFGSVAISPDQKRVAAGTFDGFIKMWNSETGQEVLTMKVADVAVWHVQFLPPDGNVLVSVTPREAHLWRAPSLDEIVAAEAKERTQGKH